MRFLLVEDDAALAKSLERGLREQAYAVDVATDGEDALYQASINPYDAIILDVNLPKIDGFTVCRSIRKAGSAVRILMLTARGNTEDRIQGLDSGADDYLAKPFEFEELLARLRALLRRRGEQVDQATYLLDNMEIDFPKQRVRRGGRSWSSPPRSTHCWRISRATRERSSVALRSPSTCGTTTMIPRRTRWRCTSIVCARKSIARDSRPSSRRDADRDITSA